MNAGNRTPPSSADGGSIFNPMHVAVMDDPVSVCHQWFSTGTRNARSAQRSVSMSQCSPAVKIVRNESMQYLRPYFSSGSARRMTRNEVGTVNSAATRCCSMMLRDPKRNRQRTVATERPSCHCATLTGNTGRDRASDPACPRTSGWCSRPAAGRSRCTNGQPPSPCPRRPTRRRRAECRRSPTCCTSA